VLACGSGCEKSLCTYSSQAAVQAGKARPGNLLTRSLIRLHTPELLLHTFWTVIEIGIRWGSLLRFVGLHPHITAEPCACALSLRPAPDKHTTPCLLTTSSHL